MTVRCRVDQQVAFLTWDRPERRNAIGVGAARELTAQLTELASSDDVAAIVLDSVSGPFCSGFDLSDLSDLAAAGEPGRRALLAAGRTLMATLGTQPQLLIATPREYALGLGCALLARCDIVIAEETTGFGLPEIRAGVVPTIAAADLLGVLTARTILDWAVDGRRRTASDAARAGLVTRVDPDPPAALADLLEAIRAHPRQVRDTKAAVRLLAATPAAERAAVAVDLAVAGIIEGPS